MRRVRHDGLLTGKRRSLVWKRGGVDMDENPELDMNKGEPKTRHVNRMG